MSVIVPRAEGFEENEGVTIIDVLRRAGIGVTSVFLEKNPVIGSHSIAVTADKSIDEIRSSDFDCIVLPGGMPGSSNLKADARVIGLVKEFAGAEDDRRPVYAAPLVVTREYWQENKPPAFPGSRSR